VEAEPRGLVCLLVTLAALEEFGQWVSSRGWLPWRRRRPGPSLTAVGVEELDAFIDVRHILCSPDVDMIGA
jgi:hypothetical protein